MTINNAQTAFNRILCPIDLKAESDDSLRYGIALAKACNAKLFVINCVDRYTMSGSRERKRIAQELDTAVRKHLRLPLSPGFTWDNVMVDGDPKTAIAQEAAERRIDLIVMRSRRRPYAAALLGSTAESLCRTAPCPVLIIHPREQNWVGITTNDIGLLRVLVAYDFSSDSELALSYGLSLAEEYQAEIHLLHVLPARLIKPAGPEAAFWPPGADKGLREAASRLRGSVSSAIREKFDVKQVLREGHPYREVLSYAEEQNIDLICIGASGTGFGMRALFGSNSDRVLRQAPCPVLITRPLRPAMATLTA